MRKLAETRHLLALLLAAVMVFGVFVAPAVAGGEVVSVVVSVQGEDSFLIPRRVIDVEPGLAVAYGYPVNADPVEEGQVSVLDVLVAAHVANLGDDLDAISGVLVLGDYGFVSSAFGVSEFPLGFAVNGKQPNDGVWNDTYQAYTGFGANQAQVSSGDVVEFFYYKDASWGDYYSWFEDEGTKVEELSVGVGEEFSLTLKGYVMGWYGCSNEETILSMTEALAEAQVAMVDTEDGSITPIESKTTSDAGVVALSFGEAGTYVLAATRAEGAPIISPWLVVTVGDKATEGEPDLAFTDVHETDWFYEHVEFVVENGLYKGTSETEFSPNQPMTRAMLVTVLHRLAGTPQAESTDPGFEDVASGQWYTDAVQWGTAEGILEGYGSGLFGTNDLVTREQVATVLFRYAVKTSSDTSQTSDLETFADAQEVSAWALDAIKWAVGADLIGGKADGALDPKGPATRAEVAAILNRFVNR